jgi:hypothetical protein
MERKRQLLGYLLAVNLALLLCSCPRVALGRVWSDRPLEGGVVNDLAFDTTGTDKFVFASCMEGGLHHIKWDSGNSRWDFDWERHIIGCGSYGVDAKVMNDTLRILSATEAGVNNGERTIGYGHQIELL